MITKEAKSRNYFIRHKYYYNSARTCFAIILSNILGDDDKILMPAYIGQSPREGSGVFDPIRQTGSNYEFYKLKSNLQVDAEDIKKKITDKRIKALLLIHYFGYPQKDIYQIKELCETENVILIEDCAHTLNSAINDSHLGDIGDISFYSLHKLIACNDGGCLQVNNPRYYNCFETYKENIAIEDLLQYTKTNIEEISNVRIDNYNYYLSLLRKDSDIFDVLYPAIDKGVVPLNFPIIVKNYDRFILYNELIEKGVITVSLYYQMIEELDVNDYPESFRISNTILNLPVHQETKKEDIEYICQLLNNWSSSVS